MMEECPTSSWPIQPETNDDIKNVFSSGRRGVGGGGGGGG